MSGSNELHNYKLTCVGISTPKQIRESFSEHAVNCSMSSRSYMNERAAFVATRYAQVVIEIEPVHVSLTAAADWQWYPARIFSSSLNFSLDRLHPEQAPKHPKYNH